MIQPIKVNCGLSNIGKNPCFSVICKLSCWHNPSKSTADFKIKKKPVKQIMYNCHYYRMKMMLLLTICLNFPWTCSFTYLPSDLTISLTSWQHIHVYLLVKVHGWFYTVIFTLCKINQKPSRILLMFGWLSFMIIVLSVSRGDLKSTCSSCFWKVQFLTK